MMLVSGITGPQTGFEAFLVGLGFCPYEGTGEQTVRVEYVHVHPGGQAIVGAVSNRKVEGGEVERSTREPLPLVRTKSYDSTQK
jgi:hypothetical protein